MLEFDVVVRWTRQHAPSGAKARYQLKSDRKAEPQQTEVLGVSGETCERSRLLHRQGNVTESLILAQDQRWRRALSMQVERRGASLSVADG